jgi:hypothetical protein
MGATGSWSEARVILFSIGLPGRLAEWCDGVLAHLAGRRDEGVAIVTCPTVAKMFGYEGITAVLDEVALSLIKTNAIHLVLGARQPDEALRALLGHTKVRFVVALDDPRVAVADILASANGELRTVTRAIANSCPLVMRCASLPEALTIRGSRSGLDAPTAVAAIARHFELPLDEAEDKRIVEELTACGLRYAPLAPEQNPRTVHKMADGALAAYAECFAGGELTTIIWTRELFIVNGDSGKGTTDVLDVSRSSSVAPLIYGPYIHLPPGSWSARVYLGFSAEAAGSTFLIDVFSGRQLACTSFQPGKAGIYTTEINFSLDDPSGHGLEIRVWVGSDRARGQLAFGQVILRPIAMRQPEAAIGSGENFRAVLDL